jgi:hypothetical protein
VAESDAPTPSAIAPAKPAREAAGVVIDAATQKPIAGARVLFALVDGAHAGSWWGDTTDAEGRFHPVVHDDAGLAGARFEVRVGKDGYETARVPAAEGEYRIELHPRTSPAVPGRVVGLARSADGKPFTGELEIDGSDEMGGNASQRTVADAGGAFVLDGVPPGHWELRWNGGRAEATVPEGGEARIALTAAEGGGRGFVVTDVDPSTATAPDTASQAQLASLKKLLDDVAKATDMTPAARERLSRALALEVQRLVAAAQLAQPRRDLVVTGLPSAGRAWLRFELKPRQFWRVEVQGGVAKFAAVPLGTYAAVLVETGARDRTASITVPAGDGAFTTEFR